MHKHSAVICLLLFLAGCASMEPVVSEPYDKAFPIVLRSGAVKLEVDATRPVMSADQENAVAVLASRAISIDPDMVLISYPDTLEGGAVAARISQIMVSHGLKPEVIRAITAPGPYALIAFDSAVAISPVCGNWTANAVTGPGNGAPPDFGCATQNNIAAMVARPMDLAAPRALPLRKHSGSAGAAAPSKPVSSPGN